MLNCVDWWGGGGCEGEGVRKRYMYEVIRSDPTHEMKWSEVK